MKLIISLDVWKKGSSPADILRVSGVTNVAELRRLEFIPREFGFPLTLLVSYQVARDPAACEVLAHWRDQRQGRRSGPIFHPWSTPPFVRPARTGAGARRAASRGRCLRDEIRTVLSAPGTRFPGGDAGLLPRGPLRFRPRSPAAPAGVRPPGGQQHRASHRQRHGRLFSRPGRPIPSRSGNSPRSTLLEVPLTMVPVLAHLPRRWPAWPQPCPEPQAASC